MGVPIVVTATDEGMTTEKLEAVISRLGKALPVVRGSLGFVVGYADQEAPCLVVNLVAKALTLSVREQHGEIGLWVAAAIAATLKIDLVGADGQPIPANSSSVRALLGRPFSEEGRGLAEKLDLILPRIGAVKIVVPF